MLFNGRNPHSIVVMDNCSIHHVDETVKMIQEVGALVLFIFAAVLTRLQSHEEAFSKVKVLLRSMDKEADVCDDTETFVLSVFSS